ncbi:hypothetical protein [Streptomyces zaomyceticus]|uniref:hypothetical protein n=1 Tax=Streptomyces zaomyceticus TaxID=68286 RepID=UPI0034201C22
MTEVLLLPVALGSTLACACACACAVAAEGAPCTARRPTARRPTARRPTARRPTVLLPGSRLGITAPSPLDDTLTAPRAAGSRPAAVTGGSGSVHGHVTTRDVLDEPVGPAAAV